MRHWPISTIKTESNEANKLYKKIAAYTPDEKLSREDARQLLFILRHFYDELILIEMDREKALRLRNE